MKRLFAGVLMALLCAQSMAFADTMTWKLRAFDKYAVDVSFYSQNRKAVWPGDGKVWTIKDFKVHEMKLNCVAGEKICYGAWVRGASKEYWGVGNGGKQKCTSCCYTCTQGFVTPIQNLNE